MIDASEETRRGMVWLGSATALSRALDVAASLLVISLLSREAMGAAALVLSVGEVVEAASGMGLGHSLVRTKQLREHEQQSLFWVATGVGCGLALVLVLLAPVVAWAYASPALLAMVMVTGLKHAALGAALVPQQLLQRELRFGATGAVQTLCTLATASSKLGLAALGLGAWALVLSNVIRGVAMLLCALGFSGFRPRLCFRRDDVREHWRFGLKVTGSSLLQQAFRNADYFLVGRLLGVEALGIYSVAYEVGMQALEVLTSLINRVAYPIYARVAHEAPALKAALLRSTYSLALLGAPLAVLLQAAASDLLALLTRAHGAEAAGLVEVLVFGALLRGASQLFPQVYLACGRTRYVLLDALVSGVSQALALLSVLTLFRQRGIAGVPWVFIVVYPLLLGLHLRLVQRCVPLRLIEYARALAPGLGAALLVWLGLFLVQQLLPSGTGHAVRVLTLLLGAVCLYTGYLRAVLGIDLAQLNPRRA